MIKLERSITINAPVERVFAYVEDPQLDLEWLPGLMEDSFPHLQRGNVFSLDTKSSPARMGKRDQIVP
ncbi:MAG: hypothetical protein GTN81_00810 [Proteobacteria bacterium]|nr:hypothetical protein [Pseudomonadota bacterium]